MSLGIKLLWRIRPRITSSPSLALPGRLPTHPRSALSELLPSSPLPTWRCHGNRCNTTSAPPGRKFRREKRPVPIDKPLCKDDGGVESTILELEAQIQDVPDTKVVVGEDGLVDLMTTRVPAQMKSVMDKVVGRYPARRETGSSHSRHMSKKHGALRLQKLRAAHGGSKPDWRLVLQTLRQHTRPATWETIRRTMWVSEDIVDTLLHEPDYTLWDIGLRTECVLRLHAEGGGFDADGGRTVKLVLTGSDQAMEAAKAEVALLTNSTPADSSQVRRSAIFDEVKAAIEARGKKSTKTTRTSTRWTSASPKTRPSYIDEYSCLTKYEDIPRPKEWTKRSLEAYVLRIVKATYPPPVAANLYGPGADARLSAITILQSVFANPEVKPALSLIAIRLALAFISKAGPAFRPQARAIVTQAMSDGLKPDTTIFNVLLAGNAYTHDLEGFRSILGMMTSGGHAPNFDSWSPFVGMIEDDRAKRHVFRAMDELNLLHSLPGRRTLASEFILHDLEQARGDWRGLTSFIDRMNPRYGRKWLTRLTANRLMDGLGRLGKFEACVELLDVLVTARYADVATFNIIFNHAAQYRAPTVAIVALHRAEKARISLDQYSYQELFKLFRRARKANSMSLIWTVASFKGMTRYRMRIHVSALYRAYPALLTGSDSLGATPAQPVPKSASRMKPEASYHLWRDLPTFHHHDMVPELIKMDQTIADEAREPKTPFNDANAPVTPSFGVGSAIARLFPKLWPQTTWHIDRPLCGLLVEAEAADRELEILGKSRQERAGLTSAPSGSPDEPNEIMTSLDRLASPGMRFVLRKKPDKEAIETRECESGDHPVVDLTPTIYSRTYGVPDVEFEMPLKDSEAEGTSPPVAA